MTNPTDTSISVAPLEATDNEATIIAAAIGLLKNYGSTRERVLRLLTQDNIGRVYDHLAKSKRAIL